MHELVYICQHNTVTLRASPPSLSLPDWLLVWPTEGNSYSLVITVRMMCALKCALPAWLPLKRVHWGQGGRPPRRAKDGLRREGWWEKRCAATTMDRGSNYKGEIWPDKQYCALKISIGRGVSAAGILRGGVRLEGGRQRRVRQMERCGDCDMRSEAKLASHTVHTLLSRTEETLAVCN